MKIEPDDLLRITAKLYYMDGLGEREIAKIIGVSRSKVSRLLSRAREKGIVRISVDNFEPRNALLEKKLKTRFHLAHTLVIKTIAVHAVTDVRRTIGYLAAPFAAEFLRPQSVVGVAGGRSIAELIRFMSAPRELQGITVVQLMGNIGPDVSNIDAIELSRVLAQCLGGTFYTINAPAFAPDVASRDVFLSHEHVRSIWELFDRMQTAFVGIGTLSNSAFIERGVLSASDLATLRTQGAVGEICGRFYDRNGQECKSDFRSRVVSIGIKELRQIKEVVGVTNGRERAPAITAALRGGILKSLIIDEEGAHAILEAETSEDVA
ncbi:MAG: sugar-binding transcriptional regulator [Anaerolineales bacterium]|nr:sugar-binding transcriptional regulator [Anaerolineales bacterium]